MSYITFLLNFLTCS